MPRNFVARPAERDVPCPCCGWAAKDNPWRGQPKGCPDPVFHSRDVLGDKRVGSRGR